MPVNTEAQVRRRRSAWRSTIVSTVTRVALAALLIWLWYEAQSGAVRALLLVLALCNLGTIVPLWILLKERLKEIEGGEEDAAAQY